LAEARVAALAMTIGLHLLPCLLMQHPVVAQVQKTGNAINGNSQRFVAVLEMRSQELPIWIRC
jgi:hypothetical protein